MFESKCKIHSDISQISIGLWSNIYKTGNLSLLVIEGKPKFLEDYWFNLQDQFTARYGVSEDFEKYVETLKELTITISEHIISGDNFLLNKIKMLEIDLKELERGGAGIDLQKTIPILEKYYGISMDEEMSVSKYYDRLYAMNEALSK